MPGIEITHHSPLEAEPLDPQVVMAAAGAAFWQRPELRTPSWALYDLVNEASDEMLPGLASCIEIYWPRQGEEVWAQYLGVSRTMLREHLLQQVEVNDQSWAPGFNSDDFDAEVEANVAEFAANLGDPQVLASYRNEVAERSDREEIIWDENI